MTCSRRGGFTLLEILISSGLILVLLTSVWAMFDIFSSLEVRGRRQTARARLTRGLYMQLQDDLSQATSREKSNRESPSSKTPTDENAVANGGIQKGDPSQTSVDRMALSADPVGALAVGDNQLAQPPEYAALVGSRWWLILDMPTQQGDESLSAINRLEDTDDNNWTAPEFRRRVIYHFVAPEDLLADNKLVAGLTRWQIRWRAAPLADIVAELKHREWGTTSSLVWQRPPAAGAGSALSFVAANEPQADHERIPELRRALFRYFDEESGWQSSWDSTISGRLPAAVQMRVLWRDDKEISVDNTAAANDIDELGRPMQDASAASDRSPSDQMDELKLLSEWDKDTGTAHSGTGAPPPSGYAEYLFVIPAAAGRIDSQDKDLAR